jgi:flagella basal body P-ring formation protein FlgA
MLSLLITILVAQGFCHANEERQSPRPEISVKAEVEVCADQPIRLQDIAAVDFANNKDSTAALSTVVLEPIVDGAVLNLKNNKLIKILKNKISENTDSYKNHWTYFIPDSVSIKAKKNTVSKMGIQNQIVSAINLKCPDCKVIFKDLRLPQILEKNQYTSCELQTDSLKITNSFVIPYVCFFGSQKKNFWVTGSIKVTAEGPVATRQLVPGERILAKDLKLDEVDVTYARDGIARMDDLVGQSMNRYVSVNQPIFRSDVKKELAVTRGQIVKAIVGTEDFEISSQAYAEEQGFVGDMIKIKNTETQRFLSGQIIEKGVVKIQ